MLYSLAADGGRKYIDPVVTRGRYWRIRLVLSWVLLALYFVIPHIKIAGKPGIFLDIAHRQFTVFGVTMHPTDNLILLAFGATVIISVFAVTSLYGRLWCGYGCPHPVYLEFIFRPIERWLEGTPRQMHKRDEGPWNFDRAWRKGSKWFLYAAISIFMSVTFVSYFLGWGGVWERLLTAPLEHGGMMFALGLVSVGSFVNFAWFRDQMCTVACPYGRLQTVLYDNDTIIVGYDTNRGEPRGKGRARTEESGDCVDCGRCVTTCPTGMDIRRGLQMECIGCGQCIEACDEIMEKVGKPAGLIRYTSLRELEHGEKRFLRGRVFVYAGLLTAVFVVLMALTFGRADAKIEVLRGGREPFRMLPTGEVANILRVRITNHVHEEQQFSVKLVSPEGSNLVVSRDPFPVGADAVGTVDVVAKLPEEAFENGQAKGIFRVESNTGVTLEEEFVLLGPY